MEQVLHTNNRDELQRQAYHTDNYHPGHQDPPVTSHNALGENNYANEQYAPSAYQKLESVAPEYTQHVAPQYSPAPESNQYDEYNNSYSNEQETNSQENYQYNYEAPNDYSNEYSNDYQDSYSREETTQYNNDSRQGGTYMAGYPNDEYEQSHTINYQRINPNSRHYYQEQGQSQGAGYRNYKGSNGTAPKNGASLAQKLMSYNEKFVIFALLAAIVITALIIGIGTSLFTPKQTTPSIENYNAGIPDPIVSPTDDTQTDGISKLDQADDLIIVYGQGQDTPPIKDEAKSTATTTSTVATQTSVEKVTPQAVQKIETRAKATNSAPLSARNINAAPTTTKKASPAVPTQSASAGKTQYWIQVFSTTNKDKALRIKADLAKQGISPSIVTKTINQKLYYRLRIGPYYNKAESNKFLDWIKTNDSYKDSYISVSKAR